MTDSTAQEQYHVSDETKYSTFDPQKGLRKTYDIHVVNKLIDFVEESLQNKLSVLGKLIHKNNQSVRTTRQQIDQLHATVASMQKPNAPNKTLTDDIRMFFALARTDQLDLVGRNKADRALQNTNLNKPGMTATVGRERTGGAGKSPIPSTLTKPQMRPVVIIHDPGC